MSFPPELLLLSHALSRARMAHLSGLRPARQIAMSARHQSARQLGHR
jgi:hypothetical protein